MYINYAHHEVDKLLNFHKIYNARWKSKGKESNYRQDNDIFNTKMGKQIKDGKYYKKTAKEVSESRIENKLRVRLLK
jgi:hypothetical protein